LADRRFAEELSRDLDRWRDGTASQLPGVDWSPLPLIGRLGALAALYRHFQERTLGEFGLTGVEEQVLGILRSGVADTPGELALLTHQTPSGLTRTLDRLEARGMVGRALDRNDRRRMRVSLTHKGRNVAERKLEVQIGALHALLAGLDRRALKQLSATLDDLLARLAGLLRPELPKARRKQTQKPTSSSSSRAARKPRQRRRPKGRRMALKPR
jgi:DNA-binding MarR family transcriptional regulator